MAYTMAQSFFWTSLGKWWKAENFHDQSDDDVSSQR